MFRIICELTPVTVGPAIWDQITIIHGAARGADTLAGLFAKMFGTKVEAYPADWDTHGKAAGPIRNQQMLDEGKPDLVVAFPGGAGTKHMKETAARRGFRVIVVP
jgi:hypothetical protein